jgi:alpha-D-ribose 1-methylphosphonate 5-triphosphate synthase subunit PhnG
MCDIIDPHESQDKVGTVMEREQLNYFLQQAPFPLLSALCEKISKEAAIELIQKPTSQTLLVPVVDPINQGTFISGEVLVSSAIVQVNGVNGWAMVMDENPELATSLAVLDGAYAAGMRKLEIVQLAGQGKEAMDSKHADMNARVNSTRVSFDLL